MLEEQQGGFGGRVELSKGGKVRGSEAKRCPVGVGGGIV